MKIFVYVLVLLIGFAFCQSGNAQTLPNFPDNSLSLEKVLCGLRERYDAVQKQHLAVLEEGKSKLLGGTDFVVVESDWFNGSGGTGIGGGIDGAEWTVFDPITGIVTSQSVSGASSRTEFAEAISNAITNLPPGPKWGVLNTAYPTAGSAVGLNPEQIDTILNEARENLEQLYHLYVNISVTVGQAVPDFWVPPYIFGMGQFPSRSYKTTKITDQIRELAEHVQGLKSFRPNYFTSVTDHTSYEWGVQSTKPTLSVPIPLNFGNKTSYETYGCQEYFGFEDLFSIVASGNTQAFLSADTGQWHWSRSTYYTTKKLFCPVGKLKGKVGVTISANRLWNHIENSLGPSTFGPLDGPCSTTIWKTMLFDEDEDISIDSTTPGISSLLFDASSQSLKGSIEDNGTSLTFVSEDDYPTHSPQEEFCHIDFLIQPTFKYAFSSESFDVKINSLGEVSFDGNSLKIYLGRSSSRGGVPVNFQIQFPVNFPEGSGVNYANPRHWTLSGGAGEKNVIYSSRKDDLPEPDWSETEWPGGNINSPYGEWLNYFDYKFFSEYLGDSNFISSYSLNSFFTAGRNVVRQILTKDSLVDIVKVSSFKYNVNIYARPVNLIQDANTGLYSLNGSPLATVSIENPANDLASIGQVLLRSEDYTYGLSQSANYDTTYSIRKGGTLISERYDNRVVYHSDRPFEYLTCFKVGDLTTDWFHREFWLANPNLENSFSGFSNSGKGFIREFDFEGKVTYLKQVEADYEYKIGVEGLPSLIGSGPYQMTRTQDPSDSTLVSRVETRNGATVGKGWEIRPNLTEVRYITATNLNASSPTDSSNLVTTYHFDNGDGANPWALSAIDYPDGTTTTFNYASGPHSGGETWDYVTVISGKSKMISAYNRKGVLVEQTLKDTASNTILSSATATETDPVYGYPTEVAYSDGTTTEATYEHGILQSFKDHFGKTTNVAYDDLQRLSSVARDGLTTALTYNPDSTFGAKITLPDGTSATQATTDYGLLQSSKMEKTGVASVNSVRQTDKSFTTTYNRTLGGANFQQQNSVDGLPTQSTGNAAEPFDYEITPATIPETSIHGLKTVATHKPGGAASGIAYTNYTDGAGRLIRSEAPSAAAGGGIAVTKYIYTNARLTSLVDPDGVTTLLGYDGTGELTTIAIDLNGSGTINAGDRMVKSVTTVSSSGVETELSTGFGSSELVVERRLAHPETNAVEVFPDNDSARKIAITLSQSGTTETLSAIIGTSGNVGTANMVFEDGSLKSSSITTGGISKGFIADLNSLGQWTGVSSTGIGPASSATIDPDTGLVTSTTVGSQHSSMSVTTQSGGKLLMSVTDNGKTRSTLWNVKGDFLESSGDDQIDFTLSEPTYASGEIKRTLTLGGSDTEFSSNLGGGNSKKTYPDSHQEKAVYSAAGRLLSSTNARGQKTEYQRSNGVDVDQIDLPEGGSIGLSWTADGKVNDLTDHSGKRVFGYTNGHLTSIHYDTGPLSGKTLTYSLDSLGRPSGVSVTGGDEVTYGYNGLQLTSVTNSTAGRTAAFSGTVLPNGIPQTMAYGPLSVTKTVNGNGKLTSIASTANGTTSNFAYGYDSDGKRNQITFGGNRVWDVTYGDEGQLDTAVEKEGAVGQLSYSYATSSVGNPTAKTRNGSTTSFLAGPGGLNQVGERTNSDRSVTVVGSVAPAGVPPASTAPAATVKIDGVPQTVQADGSFSKIIANLGDLGGWVDTTVEGRIAGAGDEGHDAVAAETQSVWLRPLNETLSYDLDGSRTGDSKFDYGWDSQNRLVSVTEKVASSVDGALNIHYDYDSGGRRFRKQIKRGTVLQSETLFVYDGWKLLLEEQRNGAGALEVKRSYTWGPDLSGTLDGAGGVGGLLEIAETKGSATSRSIPLFDGNGNVTALVDATSGAKVAEYEYDLFGELISESGDRVDSCPLRFSTKYYEAETGLYYFGYRYYDPQTRQWISRDPMGEAGGVNIYAFCANDPVNKIDPDGLSPQDPYDNSFRLEALSYMDSPLAGDRLYGMGVGLLGLPQFVYDTLAYTTRIGAPAAFARANERVRLEEINGTGGPQVVFDRLTGSAASALYGPVLLVANIDQAHKIPGAFIDKVGSDWNSFGSSPVNATYGLIEDATVVYGLGRLAQSSTKLVGRVSSEPLNVPSYEQLRKLASEDLDFSTGRNGALFWSGSYLNMKLAQIFGKISGKTTLEQTNGGRYLNDLKLFDNLPAVQAAEIWDIASLRYTSQVTGNVKVFRFGAQPIGNFGLRTWWRTEYPEIINQQQLGNVNNVWHFRLPLIDPEM